tara:strand:- start:322 stop:1035 length:714 start_codon:yes stop_codon:yes gene_type:complete
VSIGAFNVIEDHVIIGDNTSLGNYNTISTGTIIGANCKIFHNNSIGEAPQDMKYNGEKTLAIIGDNVTIREFVTINRGTSALGETRVGDNVLLMACTHVAHDCIVGDNTIMANLATLGGHVEIGEWVNIGGGVVVHQFVKIGEQSLIGGGFCAKQDIPPYIIVAGHPLRFIGINKIGLERRGYSSEARLLIKKAYREYFISKKNRGQALAIIKNNFKHSEEIEKIINFIESSNRGIV